LALRDLAEQGRGQPGAAPEHAAAVIDAWNFLGGLEWAGVPLAAEIFGFDDVEFFARMLAQIRDHNRRKDAREE
jgi:hypothetical protein